LLHRAGERNSDVNDIPPTTAGRNSSGGRRSRDKGSRIEREIVRRLQAQGFAAEKISGMYRPGADLSVPFLGIDRAIEVKCRAHGFSQLYTWLTERFALIVRADRCEPLIVLRLKDAAAIAALAEKVRAP
jgi:Holliday junction resolvase